MHRGLWVVVIVFIRLVVIVVGLHVGLAGMAGLLMPARRTESRVIGRLHDLKKARFNEDLEDRSGGMYCVRIGSITTARAVQDRDLGLSIIRIWTESQCLGAEDEMPLTSLYAGITCASFYTPVAAVQQGLRIAETHSHQKLPGRYQDYRSRCLWPRPCDTGLIPHRRVREFRSIPQKSGRYGFIIPSHHVPDRIGVDGQAMNRC